MNAQKDDVAINGIRNQGHGEAAKDHADSAANRCPLPFFSLTRKAHNHTFE